MIIPFGVSSCDAFPANAACSADRTSLHSCSQGGARRTRRTCCCLSTYTKYPKRSAACSLPSNVIQARKKEKAHKKKEKKEKRAKKEKRRRKDFSDEEGQIHEGERANS